MAKSEIVSIDASILVPSPFPVFQLLLEEAKTKLNTIIKLNVSRRQVPTKISKLQKGFV